MTDTGSAPRSAAGRTVERTLAIAAPVDAVWRALTDAEELVRWFPLEATVTPGEGGSMTLGWGDLYHATGRITVWQQGRHLRFDFPGEGPAPLVTDYFLEGNAGGTTLRVVTSGFGAGADWEEQFRGVSHGWDFELLGLAHYLERHRGKDRRVAWARGRSHLGFTETWARLVSPGGAFGAGGLVVERSGDPLVVDAGGGTVLNGRVALWQPPRQVAAVIDAMNHALFRAELNGPEGDISVVLWLSTYEIVPTRVAVLEAAWRARLAHLVSDPPSRPESRNDA